MICINKKCAADLPDDAIFCTYCGRKKVREAITRTRSNGEGTVYRRSETWTAEVTRGWKKEADGKRKRIYATKGGFKTKKKLSTTSPNSRAAQVAAR